MRFRLQDEWLMDAVFGAVGIIIFVIVTQPTVTSAILKGGLLVFSLLIVIHLWNKYLGD